MVRTFVLMFAVVGLFAIELGHCRAAEPATLALRARTRQAEPGAALTAERPAREIKLAWDPAKTALIICDMWDAHWCRGASDRVVELAPAIDEVAKQLRAQGALIIHAPSTCMNFYANTPQRKRAQAAPFAKSPVPFSQAERWGTRWCWPDPKRETDLPIDDSDMGCDCTPQCEIHDPWKRQIALIEIAEPDAISDDGQEVFNLLVERGIENVLIAGVHLNMCVLGRSFAIREMAHVGKNIVLIRDLTDTMYNSRRKPFVDHFSGTDLVVEHVEKFWCPTVASVDLGRAAPFRFAADKRD